MPQPPTNVRPDGLAQRLGLTGVVRTPEWDEERLVQPGYDVGQDGYLNYTVELQEQLNVDISANTNVDLKFGDNSSRIFFANITTATAAGCTLNYNIIDPNGNSIFIASWALGINESVRITQDGSDASIAGASQPVGLMKYALPAGWSTRFRFVGGGVGDTASVFILVQLAPIGTSLPSY